MLYPNRVNVIDTELLSNTPSWCVLHVQNHMCDKPWRVLTTTLFPCPITGTFKIAVITRTKCFIQRGEILCHATSTDVNSFYDKLTGKCFFKTIQRQTTFFNYFPFLAEDAVYYSEDDHSYDVSSSDDDDDDDDDVVLLLKEQHQVSRLGEYTTGLARLPTWWCAPLQRNPKQFFG